MSQLFNLFRRAKNRSELSSALIDALPGQLNADAAAVAWYGEGGGVSDLLFTGIPAPVIQQYERCAAEVDVVQAECVKAMRCVDSAMLFTDGEWQKQAMYREIGRPAKVYHHLVSPIVRESGVIGVLSVARREEGRPFAAAEREQALTCSMFASLALARIDGSATAAGSGPTKPLTRRERQVADLVARGRANKEIAAALDISENTVKACLKVVFAKLSIGSRVELAVMMAR